MTDLNDYLIFSQNRRKLPTGEQSFADLRARGLCYVDKTLFVYDIACDNVPKFLSRPRRFGKSTLVSTLKELFLHGVKPYDGHDSYFKGLTIEKLWNDEGEYKVLSLSFAGINDGCASFAEFELNFAKEIANLSENFGITVSREQDALSMFKELIEKARSNQLVFLLDEYDAPLIAYFQTEDEARAARFMRGVFNKIKENSGKFRCVFVTGITRYKDAYLLTAGNSFTDISLNKFFGPVCGYTKEELLTVFKDHVDYAAAKLSNLPLNAVTDEARQALLAKLELWYDGYVFDKNCSTKVFSTWSILSFFGSMEAEFSRYWYDTAGTPSLLIKAFLKSDYRRLLENFDHGCINVDQDAFTSPSSFSKMTPEVLLYQMGYLTLAEPISLANDSSPVRLRLPNEEIRSSFRKLLPSALKSSSESANQLFKHSAQAMTEAVTAQDPKTLMEVFNRLFQTFDYEGEPLSSEAWVTNMMLIFVLAMSDESNAQVNRHEAGGRPDLVFEVSSTRIVIENKFVTRNDPQKLDEALQNAVDQIRSHHYGESLSDKKKLWRVGLVFCGASRRLERCASAD